MATWIAHLRIAENILNKGYNFAPESFVVGNIGPDSGVPNEDWSIFNTIFKNIRNVPDYLDYFPNGAFERQVKYITDFYLGENNETKDNFIFLNEEEMDNFIESATKAIDELLSELLIEKATAKKKF